MLEWLSGVDAAGAWVAAWRGCPCHRESGTTRRSNTRPQRTVSQPHPSPRPPATTHTAIPDTVARARALHHHRRPRRLHCYRHRVPFLKGRAPHLSCSGPLTSRPVLSHLAHAPTTLTYSPTTRYPSVAPVPRGTPRPGDSLRLTHRPSRPLVCGRSRHARPRDPLPTACTDCLEQLVAAIAPVETSCIPLYRNGLAHQYQCYGRLDVANFPLHETLAGRPANRKTTSTLLRCTRHVIHHVSAAEQWRACDA